MIIFIVEACDPNDQCDRAVCGQPAALRFTYAPGRKWHSCAGCWVGLAQDVLRHEGFTFDYTLVARARLAELVIPR